MSEVFQDNYSFRFDSEYVKKEYLDNIVKLRSKEFYRLENCIEHMSGGATPLGAEYETEGTRFLRVQNIMQNYFNLSDVVYLNEKQDNEIKRSRLKFKDVLLTITGVSYGKSATVSKDLVNSNINQHSVKITLNNNLNPYFLSTFLNSYYGKTQSDKNIVGVTRPALDYTVIKNFIIPKLNLDIEEAIETLLLKSEIVVKKSKQLYTQAENLLLKEVSLQDFEPSKEAVNIKTLSESFGTSGRLDAEYYQPKYDDLEEKILAQQYIKIEDIKVSNFRGLQPKYNEEGTLDVINSKHILEDNLDYKGFNKTSLDYWEIQKRARVYKGDVLTYTTGANIGRTQVYKSTNKALGSNHVNILRVKDYNPIYIGFVMNSIVGRLQTEKLSAGSAQAELYPKDIDKFLIPIIEIAKQEQIAALIEESFSLKKQSEHLLEVAKRAVEKAIEENEAVAMDYIKEETK